MTRNLGSLVLLLLCWPAAADPASVTVPELAALQFSTCEIRGTGGRGRATAECARVRVPENPGRPDGRQIELFVARLPALAAQATTDAVTLINGGPGASSVSMYVDYAHAFEALRRDRDIVVVDQRGTGRSAPLECPELEQANYGLDRDVLAQATRHCLEGLKADPRYYTTSVAATDLEAVRRALGYRQWNIYGVSYGTRVAQHYLQRFPEATRTLIIDGVIPPRHVLGPDIALNAQQALDGVLARCRAEAGCDKAFPDLRRQLRMLIERLRRQVITLDIPHPVTGQSHAVNLQYAQLALSLRMMSYAPETMALIPLIVREAAEQRNYLPLAAQSVLVEDGLVEAISFGMHNSVVCTEDVPFYGNLEALWPRLVSTYLGDTQVRALQEICGLWPRGVMHPSLREPLRADAPVLLLSGEFDPITPPAYGEKALSAYPNGRHLVAPGQGHGVVGRGCLPLLVSDFVAAASTSVLDAACVERLRGDAFFVDLLGPPP